MPETAASTETVQPAQAASVAAPAPAPTPAPEATSSYVSRFTPEQIESIEKADPITAREWTRSLSEEERKILAQGGLKALLPAATQKTDPTPAPVDPAVAPVADPGTTPPATGTEPPAGDTPSWVMTDEELAQASPKVIELYKTFLDAQEKLESAPAPAPDPYADDPIVAWRRQALESGNAGVPDFSAEDIINLAPGGRDGLYDALDEAHATGDKAAWQKALDNLVKTTVEHTKQRTVMQANLQLKEAEKARDEGRFEGALAAKVTAATEALISSIPEYAKSQEPLIVLDDKGQERFSKTHPAREFIDFIIKEGEIFDVIVRSKGPKPALRTMWNEFQAEKAGGHNRLMANIRAQEGLSIAQKAKAALNGFLASKAAPSVGTVQAPANGGNNQPLYHGFDLSQIRSPEQVQNVYKALRNSGNHAAAQGLAAALAGIQPR